jgi:tetratricopeptide (TPR) repeat protein
VKILHLASFGVLAGAALLAAAGCGGPSSVSKRTVNGFLAQRQYAQAEAYLDAEKESEYGKRNMVLYYLDKGLVQHHAGKFKESDASFDMAERRMDELYTASLSKAAGLLVINDQTMDYAGEPFERALTHVCRALNYVFLGNHDEALVESRKVERFLTELGDRAGSRKIYKDDAFARYLDALLYADAGKRDDARISYQAAQNAYADYQTIYGTPSPRFDFPKGPQKRGELVFIHYNGVAPRKITKTFQIAWNQALPIMRASGDAEAADARVKNALAAGFMGSAVTVAFPAYTQDPYAIASSEIFVDSRPVASTILMEDVSAIATKTLEQRMAVIKARAIARATIKFIVAEAVSKAAAKACDQMPGGYFAVQACKLGTRGAAHGAAAASEFADTRGWAVLPAQIRMARVKVEPGRHDVAIYYKNDAGVMISSQAFSGVLVADHERTYLSARTAQ